MAEKRRIIKIEDLRKRVRYGRATLSVGRFGILGADLSGSIATFNREEISAEELCDAFVRSRVRDHSPTFDWDEADPERVLALVVDASEGPVFSSYEPDVVAQELVEAAEREGERIRETLRKARRQIAAQPAIAGIAANHAGQIASFRSQLDSMVKPLGIFTRNPVASIAATSWKASAPDWLGTKGIGADISKLTALRPAINSSVLKGFGIDGDVVSSKQHLLGASAMVEAAKFRQPDLGQNFGLLSVFKPNYFIDTPGFESLAGQLIQGSKLTFGFPEPAPWLKDLQRIGERFADWVENAKDFLPVNWRELESRELSQVVEVMKTEGLCLAWAPREEIVLEMAAAETSRERCRILIERRGEIVDDIEQSLAEIEAIELMPYVGAATKAIAAAAGGHSEVALSHVAAAITAVVHERLGYERFGPVREEYGSADPLHEVGFQQFPLYAVGRTLVYALDHIKNAGEGFNRNLTAASPRGALQRGQPTHGSAAPQRPPVRSRTAAADLRTARLGDDGLVRRSSALVRPQRLAALLGREQPAEGADLPHLDRIPIQTGQDVVDPVDVADGR